MPDLLSEIHAAARRHGVDPLLFEALVRQESRGRMDLPSSAGAIGFSQLMPDTAKELGVDPNDPLQNLEGGARYLRQQLDAVGGDRDRALQAYHSGLGNVQRGTLGPRGRAYPGLVARYIGQPWPDVPAWPVTAPGVTRTEGAMQPGPAANQASMLLPDGTIGPASRRTPGYPDPRSGLVERGDTMPAAAPQMPQRGLGKPDRSGTAQMTPEQMKEYLRAMEDPSYIPPPPFGSPLDPGAPDQTQGPGRPASAAPSGPSSAPAPALPAGFRGDANLPNNGDLGPSGVLGGIIAAGAPFTNPYAPENRQFLARAGLAPQDAYMNPNGSWNIREAQASWPRAAPALPAGFRGDANLPNNGDLGPSGVLGGIIAAGAPFTNPYAPENRQFLARAGLAPQDAYMNPNGSWNIREAQASWPRAAPVPQYDFSALDSPQSAPVPPGVQDSEMQARIVRDTQAKQRPYMTDMDYLIDRDTPRYDATFGDVRRVEGRDARGPAGTPDIFQGAPQETAYLGLGAKFPPGATSSDPALALPEAATLTPGGTVGPPQRVDPAARAAIQYHMADPNARAILDDQQRQEVRQRLMSQLAPPVQPKSSGWGNLPLALAAGGAIGGSAPYTRAYEMMQGDIDRKTADQRYADAMRFKETDNLLGVLGQDSSSRGAPKSTITLDDGTVVEANDYPSILRAIEEKRKRPMADEADQLALEKLRADVDWEKGRGARDIRDAAIGASAIAEQGAGRRGREDRLQSELDLRQKQFDAKTQQAKAVIYQRALKQLMDAQGAQAPTDDMKQEAMRQAEQTFAEPGSNPDAIDWASITAALQPKTSP